MLRAQDVLQAYTMMSISMMVVLTSLRRQEEHISKQEELQRSCGDPLPLTWTPSG